MKKFNKIKSFPCNGYIVSSGYDLREVTALWVEKHGFAYSNGWNTKCHVGTAKQIIPATKKNLRASQFIQKAYKKIQDAKDLIDKSTYFSGYNQ